MVAISRRDIRDGRRLGLRRERRVRKALGDRKDGLGSGGSGVKDMGYLCDTLEDIVFVYFEIFITTSGTEDRFIIICWSSVVFPVLNEKLWCSKSDCRSIVVVLQRYLPVDL